MGLFGGDEDNATDELLQQGQAELEQKRHDLYQTRLDIIKGQGGQNWAPGAPQAYSGGRGWGANAFPIDISKLPKPSQKAASKAFNKANKARNSL